MKTNCQSSGTCLGVMKLCLAIVVWFSTIGHHHHTADAAVCTAFTNMTCVATDFTLATCDTKTFTCGCTTDYFSIPTGCAKKLAIPTVMTEPGRTTEFIAGAKAVKLTCSTVDAAFLTYEWIKGGTVVEGAILSVYEVIGSDTEIAGSYECATKYGTETSGLSKAVDIKQVGTVVPAPKVSTSPSSAAVGATINLECTNIPYGATVTFKLDGKPIESPVKFVADQLKNDLLCIIDSTQKSPTASSPVKLSTIIAGDIEKATIKAPGSLSYKTGASVNVTCETEPPAQYMEFGTKTIVYAFKDSKNMDPGNSGKTYTVKSKAGVPATHVVSCTANYDKQGEKKSGDSNLIFRDDIKPPNLIANSVEVILGSRLVLTCGDATDGITYTWKKDGAPIFRQRDRIIQYGNFQKTDAGKYKCTVTNHNFELDSNEATITVKSTANSLHVLGSTLLLALVALASSKIL